MQDLDFVPSVHGCLGCRHCNRCHICHGECKQAKEDRRRHYEGMSNEEFFEEFFGLRKDGHREEKGVVAC